MAGAHVSRVLGVVVKILGAEEPVFIADQTVGADLGGIEFAWQ
jgi:hypothetical protein